MAEKNELYEAGYGESHSVSCNCVSPDAEIAYAAVTGNTEHVKQVANQSHFWLDFTKCKSCGRHFMCVFTELINWNGGNDSMANAWVPLEEGETERVLSMVNSEGDISRAGLRNHRSLWLDTNNKKYWKNFFEVLPHD